MPLSIVLAGPAEYRQVNMIYGLTLIFVAMLFLAGINGVSEFVARRKMDIVSFSALMSWLQFLVTLLCVPWKSLADGLPCGIWELAALMTMAGLVNAAGFATAIAAMRLGHAGISAALGQSAMLISYCFSLVVWKESASILNLAGIAMIIGMFFLVTSKESVKPAEAGENGRLSRWLMLVLACAAAYGIAQILFLIPSRWPEKEGLQGLRPSMLVFAQAVAFSVIGLAGGRKMDRSMAGPALAGGVVSGGFLCVLAVAADVMTKAHLTGLVYPLAVSGGILSFSLYSRFFLREKYSARSWAGIVIGVIGIILVCIR